MAEWRTHLEAAYKAAVDDHEAPAYLFYLIARELGSVRCDELLDEIVEARNG